MSNNDKDNKPSNIKTFFKKNLTIGKQFVLQTIGKADQIEFPARYECQNNIFKATQAHYKEVSKEAGQFLKQNSALIESEQNLGATLLRFADTIKSDGKPPQTQQQAAAANNNNADNYSSNATMLINNNEQNASSNYHGGENVAPVFESKLSEQDTKRKKRRQMYDEENSELLLKFGETMGTITSLRYNLHDTISSQILTKVNDFLDDGLYTSHFKEEYREVLLKEGVKHNAVRSMKEKNNLDIVQVGKAEKEYEEAKKKSDETLINMMDEFDYQEERRDIEYINSVRKAIAAYRAYFLQGAELMNNLEKYITPRDIAVSRPTHLKLLLSGANNNNASNSNSGPSSAAKALQMMKNTKGGSADTKFFGVSLERIMERESEKGHDVPAVFETMCQFLEKNALEHEGVFRLAGDHEQMMQLKKQIDNGIRALEFNTQKISDINNCASLIKTFLRDMPSPLFTFELYGDFLAASRLENPEEQLQVLCALIEKLPRYNAQVLERLLVLLNQVVERSEVNKMTSSNCAIVFGINILKSKDDNPLLLARDTAHVNKITMTMINHRETIIANIRKRKQQFASQQQQQQQQMQQQAATLAATMQQAPAQPQPQQNTLQAPAPAVNMLASSPPAPSYMMQSSPPQQQQQPPPVAAAAAASTPAQQQPPQLPSKPAAKALPTPPPNKRLPPVPQAKVPQAQQPMPVAAPAPAPAARQPAVQVPQQPPPFAQQQQPQYGNAPRSIAIDPSDNPFFENSYGAPPVQQPVQQQQPQQQQYTPIYPSPPAAAQSGSLPAFGLPPPAFGLPPPAYGNNAQQPQANFDDFMTAFNNNHVSHDDFLSDFGNVNTK